MSLDLKNVAVRWANSSTAFGSLYICVERREFATVMGPSGVGESNLLDAIAGHLAPACQLEGRITLNGIDLDSLSPEARRIGLMFQDGCLFPHLSVGDNLAFGLTRTVMGRAQRHVAVEVVLKQAGLDGFYSRDSASISGGQRARTALVRTLLADPAALLLDEPFSKLDLALRGEVRSFTYEHIRHHNISALLVTHDSEDAKEAGDENWYWRKVRPVGQISSKLCTMALTRST